MGKRSKNYSSEIVFIYEEIDGVFIELQGEKGRYASRPLTIGEAEKTIEVLSDKLEKAKKITKRLKGEC